MIALVLSAVAQCTRDRCVHAPSQRSRAVDHRPIHDYIGVVGRIASQRIEMAEQSGLGASGVPSGEVGASSSRPLVLLEPYIGVGDWRDLMEHFGIAAVNSRWEVAATLLWLRVRMVGGAETAFRGLAEAARGKSNCTGALRERAVPRSKRESCLAELLGRQKRRGEDRATFAEDLESLTHYPGQLEHPQLAFRVTKTLLWSLPGEHKEHRQPTQQLPMERRTATRSIQCSDPSVRLFEESGTDSYRRGSYVTVLSVASRHVTITCLCMC